MFKFLLIQPAKTVDIYLYIYTQHNYHQMVIHYHEIKPFRLKQDLCFMSWSPLWGLIWLIMTFYLNLCSKDLRSLLHNNQPLFNCGIWNTIRLTTVTHVNAPQFSIEFEFFLNKHLLATDTNVELRINK